MSYSMTITNEQLQERAEGAALRYQEGRVFKFQSNSGPRTEGFQAATLEHLTIHRDTLAEVEELPHNILCPALPLGKISSEEVGDCNCGLDQHIASLRELLGVSQ